jgi:hypothetical protein
VTGYTIVLVSDPIGVGIALLAVALVALALVCSWRYFDSVEARCHCLVLLFLAGMVGFAFTGDVFDMFVFFELMGAAAYALTGFKVEDPTAVQGALNFGIVNSLGAYVALMGVVQPWAVLPSVRDDAARVRCRAAGDTGVAAGALRPGDRLRRLADGGNRHPRRADRPSAALTPRRHDGVRARMILVATLSLWCSLSVQSAGPRIESIRFSLLLVLTVALLSVAFRINSHPSSSARHAQGHPTPVPSPTASAPVHVLPSSATRAPSAHPHPRATGGSAPATSVGGTGQILPVTGWDATLKLGALAFVLIGGGTLTVRAAGPRRQRAETVQD